MKTNRYLIETSVACLLWSGSIIACKISYGSIGPFTLGLMRFSLAAVIMLAMLAVTRDHDRPRGRDMAICAATGIVGTTLYFAGENYGALLLPASTSSLIIGAFPAITLALESAWDRTRPDGLKAAGIALAFVGVAVLAYGESSSGGSDVVLGGLALLGGGLCWAVYNLMMRPLLGKYSTTSITAWQTLFGALGFVPLVLLTEGLPTATPAPEALLSLAYLVLGCTVAGFILYNHSLKGLPASTAASFANLIPVFGLILSALILGETITVPQHLGGSLVVAGIFLSARS